MQQQCHVVMGVRTRYSTNGGCHKIEALLLIQAGEVYKRVTDYCVEHDSREEPWQVYHTIYAGPDYAAAQEAEVLALDRMSAKATLTE